MELLSNKSIWRATLVIGIVFAVLQVGFGHYLKDQLKRVADDRPDPTQPLPPSSSLLGNYSKAAVAANAAPCAQVGRNILESGGSAVDSAIATVLCEGIACAESMGLGGGFLMTIYNRETRTAETLNARETAPAAAYKDMFHGNETLATFGGLSIAVPGALRGYWMAHQKYGRLPWKDLFIPTIKLCQEGVPVNRHLADAIKRKEEIIRNSPALREVYIDPKTNEPWKEGDLVKYPVFANTLEQIAENGADVLYNGSLTKNFVDDIKENGGIITMEDMANYRAKWQNPIVTDLEDGNLTLYSVPPPGSGVLLAFGLNMLDDSLLDKSNITMLQRIAETFKYMYAMRTHLGDPDFVDISDLMNNLTSRDYAQSIRKLISDDRTWQDPDHYGGNWAELEDHGTAHVCIVAPNGDAVSITSTINLTFGSKVRSKSTGIILNDEMDDFSSPNITNDFGFPPSPANFIVPGKHPLSSMCPSVFVDNISGDVRLVIGAEGGSAITTSTTLVSIYNLWLNKTIKEAIDASRIHHQLIPMKITYEYGILKDEVEGLKSIGHIMERLDIGETVLTGIARNGKQLQANSDFRRGGGTDGF